jgi:hypothetical protein
MRFFYVLPFSEHQALVEYVLLGPDDYDQALKDYLESALGIKDYRILAREAGVNPLSDYPFVRRAGRRVMTMAMKPMMIIVMSCMEHSLGRWGGSPEPAHFFAGETLLSTSQ